MRKVTVSNTEKRRQIVVDLTIGLGIPVIFMILRKYFVSIYAQTTEQRLEFVQEYISQNHRFLIFEDFGCIYSSYQSWVEPVINLVPPIVIGLVSGSYAILSIRAFHRAHVQSKDILSLHSSLTNSRYIRLMAIGAIDVIGSVPISLRSLIASVRRGLPPWTGWEAIHADISHVEQYPAQDWRSYPSLVTDLEMSRWLCVACALVFFAFFGFSDEATQRYRSAVGSVGRRVGVLTESFGSSSSLFISPGYVI